MFYSHEVLSNSQYGVATVWLVATVGKGSQRRLNRKTIQNVNVPKACEKILDPGAPLALRLQGNLLYGVSRVFSHQCNYVLLDAEKTQSDMMTFFRSLNTSELDPKAGRTKRHHIVLQDDPEFDPTVMSPRLDELLNSEKVWNLTFTQESASKFSQMTPIGVHVANPKSASVSRNSSLIAIDLPHSSHSVGSYHLPGDLYRNSSPFSKAFHESDNMHDFRPFAEEEPDPICGLDLDFDADGNLIGIEDAEPDLPRMQRTSSDPLHSAGTIRPSVEQARQNNDARPDDDGILDFGDSALPTGESSLARPFTHKVSTDELALSNDAPETSESVVPLRASRRRKFQVMIDEELRISRDEFRKWTNDYTNNMMAARKRARPSLAQARRNAFALLYSNGLLGIGTFEAYYGIQHPLTADFAGNTLRAHISGLSVDDVEHPDVMNRSRRRKHPASPVEDGAQGRNVRQRLHEDADEVGRGDDAPMTFGEGLELGDYTTGPPEIGMGAAPALEDRHSSSLMPWSRQGSAAPGSATRTQPGSARKSSMPAPSPLHGRVAIASPLQRLADDAAKDEALAAAPSHSHLSGSEEEFLGISIGGDNDGNDNIYGFQASDSGGLDMSSQDFLGYVAEKATEHRLVGPQDAQSAAAWVEFEQLADPAVHSRFVAAQAFLHVLSLASKTLVTVKQDGILDHEPFGIIRVRVNAQRLAHVDLNAE